MSERTFEAARRWVDDVVVVDDEEIAAAILYALEEMKTTLEGAGAAPLAALLYKRPPKRFPAVMVLSGGNIDVHFLSRITERGLFRSGRLIRRRFLIPDRPGSLATLLAAVARERSNVISIEHDRLPPDCPPGYSTVVLLLETRDRAHGEELSARLDEQGFQSTTEPRNAFSHETRPPDRRTSRPSPGPALLHRFRSLRHLPEHRKRPSLAVLSLESTALALSSAAENALRANGKGSAGEIREILSDRVVAYALIAGGDGTVLFHTNPRMAGTILPEEGLDAGSVRAQASGGE